jgi:hypothetical protein
MFTVSIVYRTATQNQEEMIVFYHKSAKMVMKNKR